MWRVGRGVAGAADVADDVAAADPLAFAEARRVAVEVGVVVRRTSRTDRTGRSSGRRRRWLLNSFCDRRRRRRRSTGVWRGAMMSIASCARPPPRESEKVSRRSSPSTPSTGHRRDRGRAASRRRPRARPTPVVATGARLAVLAGPLRPPAARPDRAQAPGRRATPVDGRRAPSDRIASRHVSAAVGQRAEREAQADRRSRARRSRSTRRRSNRLIGRSPACPASPSCATRCTSQFVSRTQPCDCV